MEGADDLSATLKLSAIIETFRMGAIISKPTKVTIIEPKLMKEYLEKRTPKKEEKVPTVKSPQEIEEPKK